MAIVAKPKKQEKQEKAEIPVLSPSAMKYIQGAGKEPIGDERVMAKPILLRNIDIELMARLDAEAKRRRFTRTAMIRTLMLENLPELPESE